MGNQGIISCVTYTGSNGCIREQYGTFKNWHADKKVAKIGRFSAVPSAVVGVILSGALLSAAGDIGIKIIAAIIVFFVLERTLRKTLSKDVSETIEVPISEKKNQYIAGSSFAGVSSGLLGLGGGAILVTLNRSILKMDAKKAAGTSYLVAATITPVALVSHLILSRNYLQLSMMPVF